MNDIVIKIETDREQLAAWVKALTKQINEMHCGLEPQNVNAELLNDAHTLTFLSSELSKHL